MKVLRQTEKIKAPIEHVYSCLTDIEFVKSEIKRSNKESSRKLQIYYNKKSPFVEGSKIVIQSGETAFTLLIENANPNSYLKIRYVTGEKLKSIFGSGILETILSENNNSTTVEFHIFSDKEPSKFWLVFVKMAALLYKVGSWRSMRRFIKRVEETA